MPRLHFLNPIPQLLYEVRQTRIHQIPPDSHLQPDNLGDLSYAMMQIANAIHFYKPLGLFNGASATLRVNKFIGLKLSTSGALRIRLNCVMLFYHSVFDDQPIIYEYLCCVTIFTSLSRVLNHPARSPRPSGALQEASAFLR